MEAVAIFVLYSWETVNVSIGNEIAKFGGDRTRSCGENYIHTGTCLPRITLLWEISNSVTGVIAGPTVRVKSTDNRRIYNVTFISYF